MEWKILVTLAIMLLAALAFVSRTPEVASFFGYYYSFVSPSPPNVSFALVASSYGNITFTAANSRIEIEPKDSSLSVAGGALSASNVTLLGFRGTMSARGSEASLDGTVRTMEAGGAVVAYDNAPVKGTVKFVRLYAANVSLPLIAEELDGTIVVKGTLITLVNDTVKLVSPVGDVTLTDNLMMSGFAKRIELPKAGIVATE
ncbi:MAG: hypothetical protein HY365_02980 [Candidatus Aenigmarchaeota archaeon]|nr:hypothetical protein [Candidatus Aenigmarchaeota archaeon]